MAGTGLPGNFSSRLDPFLCFMTAELACALSLFPFHLAFLHCLALLLCYITCINMAPCLGKPQQSFHGKHSACATPLACNDQPDCPIGPDALVGVCFLFSCQACEC